MEDVVILNNPLRYPIQQMAGEKLGYECYITREFHDDAMHEIKRELVKRIHHEFDYRNKNNYIKLSDAVEYEITPIYSKGYDYKVTAIIETVFIN